MSRSPFSPSTSSREAGNETISTSRFQSKAFNVELSSALDIYFKNLCGTWGGTDRPVWKSSGRQNTKTWQQINLCLCKWQDFVIPVCESPTSDRYLKTPLSFEGNLLGDCWLCSCRMFELDRSLSFRTTTGTPNLRENGWKKCALHIDMYISLGLGCFSIFTWNSWVLCFLFRMSPETQRNGGLN